jgi:transglutaminase-like putative cysteine protease
MTILAVRHLTSYRYRCPVAFGEHRMMFWPRDGLGQRVLDHTLHIDPRPVSVRYTHDVFDNIVGLARFSGRARELSFESIIRLEHTPRDSAEWPIEEEALQYPFSYQSTDMPDLLRSMERQHDDRDNVVGRWARRFTGNAGTCETRSLLFAMTEAIHQEFAYVARHEAGVQEPEQTIRFGSGTCRDFAVLMMDALRSLGFATRFVSGYLHSPAAEPSLYRGGGSTHAWVQVFLPGAGWIELDPTNGIVGNRDLIRVAVVRDPRQAVPLAGTFTGFPSDAAGMHVEVSVVAEPQAETTSNARQRADAA